MENFQSFGMRHLKEFWAFRTFYRIFSLTPSILGSQYCNNYTEIQLNCLPLLDTLLSKGLGLEEHEVGGTCGTNGREEERV
jgi:hypothetical protein